MASLTSTRPASNGSAPSSRAAPNGAVAEKASSAVAMGEEPEATATGAGVSAASFSTGSHSATGSSRLRRSSSFSSPSREICTRRPGSEPKRASAEPLLRAEASAA